MGELQFDFSLLKNTHDLRLPDWGPYTNKYIGISHIADAKRGLRFDLSVFPGFYRRKVDVPNVMWESDYHPWEASPDLNFFSHRHELEWKDKVYCDISFSNIGDHARLIRCECVNNTETDQNLVLHYMASIHFPFPDAYCALSIPEGALWIDALDYNDMKFAITRPTDSLVPDGLLRGEVRENKFVNGSGLGKGFGNDSGDFVDYSFTIEYPIDHAMLLIRYRMKESQTVDFYVSGTIECNAHFEGSTDFSCKSIALGDLAEGTYTLKLISMGGSPIELDGLVIVSADSIAQVKFEMKGYNYKPELTSGSIPNSIILKYDDTDNYYGLSWDFDYFQIREFHTDELDRLMRYTVHNHVSSVFYENDGGHFTNIFLRPIYINSNSKRIIYGMICAGKKDEVEQMLVDFNHQPEGYEKIYQEQRSRTLDLTSNPEGQKYIFSQQRMAATVLANVVYPIYTKRSYIKHNTPGRWWDCLYTWDSGFLSLGLAELDLNRAIDCLNAYLTEPGDKQAAFIHHGSPVPVQHYLFLELWNKTQSKELIEYFYPRLKQYHEFLCGRLGSSTTNTLKSKLIKTWDYFYNSGGWDDYPPQVYVHANKLEKTVAPVANTSHCIRTAKILRMAATALGKSEDVAEYDEDIAVFTKAIQNYSWDEKSGYFAYVCHDRQGNPIDILRHESGKNFDMGMDGAYPLVAGICTEEQEKRLISHLTDQREMWSRIGLSTVDQSAPYYRIDGYWNGAVWMPHQWFFWKTMLDLGYGDIAFRIAQTALGIWENEVSTSYNCFEHFMVQSGRGAGWHQFSGLSSPVLSWFGTYYRPGELTCGFDVWIQSKRFYNSNSSLDANLKYYGNSINGTTIIACMNPNYMYNVMWKGTKIPFKEIVPGTLQIDLRFDSVAGNLHIGKC